MHLYSNGSVLRHDDVFAIYLLCTSILMTYYHNYVLVDNEHMMYSSIYMELKNHYELNK